jgi:hypothetical protein
MKKIILAVFLFSGTLLATAQDIKEVKTFFYLKQYAKAKESIDKYLGNEANAKKAEGWFWKGMVYNQLAREENTPIASGRPLFAESFNALKKYRELDPKAPLSVEDQNVTLYNLYYGYYDFGVKSFNAKNYEESFGDFKGALDVHDYIFSNNLLGPKEIKFNALDTDVVWNLVILGNELKKTDEVVPYYKKLADAGVSEPKYMEAYQSLVVYYKDKKEDANFDLYLDKGRKLFPKEQFWEAIDIEKNTQGLAGTALFSKYDELSAKYPSSYVLFFNYAVEIIKYINAMENKSVPEYELYSKKIPELLNKAKAIDNTADVNMLLANYYYNYSFDMTEAAGKIKGVKPDDTKKRAELVKASNKSMDDCIPYAEMAADLFSKVPKLKATEKANYRQAYDMLFEIYRAKGDAKKAAEYKAKKEAIQ